MNNFREYTLAEILKAGNIGEKDLPFPSFENKNLSWAPGDAISSYTRSKDSLTERINVQVRSFFRHVFGGRAEFEKSAYREILSFPDEPLIDGIAFPFRFVLAPYHQPTQTVTDVFRAAHWINHMGQNSEFIYSSPMSAQPLCQFAYRPGSTDNFLANFKAKFVDHGMVMECQFIWYLRDGNYIAVPVECYLYMGLMPVEPADLLSYEYSYHGQLKEFVEACQDFFGIRVYRPQSLKGFVDEIIRMESVQMDVKYEGKYYYLTRDFPRVMRSGEVGLCLYDFIPKISALAVKAGKVGMDAMIMLLTNTKVVCESSVSHAIRKLRSEGKVNRFAEAFENRPPRYAFTDEAIQLPLHSRYITSSKSSFHKDPDIINNFVDKEWGVDFMVGLHRQKESFNQLSERVKMAVGGDYETLMSGKDEGSILSTYVSQLVQNGLNIMYLDEKEIRMTFQNFCLGQVVPEVAKVEETVVEPQMEVALREPKVLTENPRK